jgi:thymidylate synthase ThyX
MPPRDIYLLSPRLLSPETIAVAFAKTSRSPDSFRTIAAELSDEKSAQFHEKWVVGYGHASVAEHAVLHLAFENVSRLAIECIESNRLASYTEKSTRYQKWSPDDFTLPPELENHTLKDEFIKTCNFLFQIYAESLAPVRARIEAGTPRRENESDEAWDRRVRSQYVDTCRFILPAAANANLGMTANARLLEHAIRKMLSHELVEVRQIGETVKQVARLETPTLVKYADAVPYLMETAQEFNDRSLRSAGGSSEWCTLMDYDPQAELLVLAALLYRFGEIPYSAALQHVTNLSIQDREELARLGLSRLGEHDIPMRELEYCSYTFDLVMDQGAYAEFKRHRMMTQTAQRLTTHLGYATPRLIAEAGFESKYEQAMLAAGELYEKLVSISPAVAQYIVPNGYNRRILARFNLREAYHFCQLRAARNAHFSIRRLALRIYEEIARVHPLLLKYIHLPEESSNSVEADYFVHA